MPIALVVATSDEAARAAIKKIKVEIDPLPIITDPREAKGKGELIIPPRTFQLGDTTNAGVNAIIFSKDKLKPTVKSIYISKHKVLMLYHRKMVLSEFILLLKDRQPCNEQ